MSDRYTKLFTLPKSLYAEGSPVLIAAGALLKDNNNGTILAQLKLQNISATEIKAATVRISSFDTLGQPIGESIVHQYLDVKAERDNSFGQREPVKLAESSARAFSALVTEVIFSDNSIWSSNDTPWEPLEGARELEKAIEDPELLKQYRLAWGKDCKFTCAEVKDLWYCTCGALNRQEEETCYKCRRQKADLLAVNLNELSVQRDARLEQEQAEREQKAKKDSENRKKLKKLSIIAAAIVAVCIVAALLFSNVIQPKLKLNRAMDLIESGDYDSAYALLEELGKSELITSNMRDRAMDLLENKDYDAAYVLLEELGDIDTIKTSKHERGKELLKSGDYETAYNLLEEVGDNDAVIASKYDRAKESIAEEDYSNALDLLDNLNYKDSEDIITEILSKPASWQTRSVGDTIIMGSYEQDNDTSNGNEAIEWLILDKTADGLLLISLYGLDCQPFYSTGGDGWEDTTWETCSLRTWLNNTFLSTAFKSDEQEMIQVTTVTADKNPHDYADPGNGTQDKIFILSDPEAQKYFKSDAARICEPTPYANALKSDNPFWWWLRTPGVHQSFAETVVNPGGINTVGKPVSYIFAVRPAMWIALKS